MLTAVTAVIIYAKINEMRNEDITHHDIKHYDPCHDIYR